MKYCIDKNLAYQMPPPLCQVNVARNVKTRIRGDMDKEQAVETTGQGALVPEGSLCWWLAWSPSRLLACLEEPSYLKSDLTKNLPKKSAKICLPIYLDDNSPVPDRPGKWIAPLLLSPPHPVQQAASSLH